MDENSTAASLRFARAAVKTNSPVENFSQSPCRGSNGAELPVFQGQLIACPFFTIIPITENIYLIASERSEPKFSYLALETCDSSQCFVGKYVCRYNKSLCWFPGGGVLRCCLDGGARLTPPNQYPSLRVI